MRSEELAAHVEVLIRKCASRITGIGHVQYSSGESQRFEIEALDELVTGILEELEDTINHSTMLHIRVRALRDRVEHLRQIWASAEEQNAMGAGS